MEESTYGTLCDVYFSDLRGPRPDQKTQATYSKKVQKYRQFLNSLELQHKARLTDLARIEDQITQLTTEFNAKKAEANENNVLLKNIKSNNAEQIRIQQLIRRRFKNPVSLTLEDGSQVSVCLDKSVEQLQETEEKLKADISSLESELATSLTENKVRLDLITEIDDLLLQFKLRCQNYTVEEGETNSDIQEKQQPATDEAADNEPDSEHDSDSMSDNYTPPE